jgi:hypothetical protein
LAFAADAGSSAAFPLADAMMTIARRSRIGDPV